MGKTQNTKCRSANTAEGDTGVHHGDGYARKDHRSLGRCPIWCHRFHLRKRRNAGHKASEEKPREGTEYSTRKWLRARIPLKAQQQLCSADACLPVIFRPLAPPLACHGVVGHAWTLLAHPCAQLRPCTVTI